jgi:hypothetical protein
MNGNPRIKSTRPLSVSNLRVHQGQEADKRNANIRVPGVETKRSTTGTAIGSAFSNFANSLSSKTKKQPAYWS